MSFLYFPAPRIFSNFWHLFEFRQFYLEIKSTIIICNCWASSSRKILVAFISWFKINPFIWTFNWTCWKKLKATALTQKVIIWNRRNNPPWVWVLKYDFSLWKRVMDTVHLLKIMICITVWRLHSLLSGKQCTVLYSPFNFY